MKRQVNVRLLVGLAVIVVVAGGFVHWLHGHNVRRSARTLLQRADQVGAAGKPADELDLLRRYLVYRPDDADALERAGLILARARGPEERAQALATLEGLLARDPGRIKARRSAADLARSLGQVDAARAHYEILGAASPGGDAEAEEALGRCDEEVKRLPEAIAWYEKAIGHDPHRLAAYARAARLLRGALRDADRADRLMDARESRDGIVARNPGSAQALLERAAYRREFALPGGEDDVRQALALSPEAADALIAAAADAPPAQAIPLLERGLAAHPADPRFCERLALALVRVGKRGEAIGHLKVGVGRLPEERNLAWLLAEFLIDDGKLDEATAVIRGLRGTKLPAPMVDFLDARLLVESQQWSKAGGDLRRVAPAIEAVRDAGGLAKRAFLVLARVEAELANPEGRLNAARRAVALDVADPAIAMAARVELASALVGVGRLDDAADEYRIAQGMPGAPPALRLDLARIQLARALRAPAAGRSWDEVDRALADAAAAAPDWVDLALLQADVLATRDRLDAAADRLRRAAEAHPESPNVPVALAALAVRRQQPGEAVAVLDRARRQLGDRPELLSAQVRTRAAQPGDAGTAGLRALAAPVAAIADPRGRWAVQLELANAFDRRDDPAAAAAIRGRLAAEQPDHLGVRLGQLDAAFQAGDLAAAAQVLDEVQRIEGPGGALWRYGRARLAIEGTRKKPDPKELDRASMLLAEARERRPGWTRATLAAAEVDDLRGDAAAALREYLAAIDGGEREPVAIRRAVELLSEGGRFPQADALLARVGKDLPPSPELGRLAADVALRLRDDDRAVDLARRAVAGRAESAADQGWLGQLLFAAARLSEAARQPDEARARKVEAERALNRAVELDPSNAEDQVARVAVLAAWGRLDDARAAIKAAEGPLAGTAGALALARCWEAVGQPDQAEARYRAVLAANPDDAVVLQAGALGLLRLGKVRDAEPILRKLIARGDRDPREAAAAKRVLANALAGEGPGGSLQARELLGLDGDPGSPGTATADPAGMQADDLRARAQVLARRPGRVARRQAIAFLQALAARDEARPDDNFLRARLLAADGDWPRARSLGMQLLDGATAKVPVLTFLARGQIAGAAPDEAGPWIEQLARLAAPPTLVAELRARLLFAQGKVREAIAMLDAMSRKDPRLGAPIARLLDGLGQPAAAEALVRAVDTPTVAPAVRVDLALTLATLLGRRGRHAEAVSICERQWANPAVPPARVSSVALIALYEGHPGEDVLRRVDAGIEAALGRQPADLVLRFDKANLLILRGRYADAESILRALHAEQPNLGAPLNNLAWLLALREGGSGKQALELIDRAITLDGPSADLLDTRGLVLIRQDQPDRAIGDLEESVAAQPAAPSYFHLALAYQKAGRGNEAGEAMAKARAAGLQAADIHPLERPAYLGLAAAFPAN